MKRFLNQISFTAEDDEAALLIEASRLQRCSKSFLLRKLIRENLAADAPQTQKSPEAA